MVIAFLILLTAVVFISRASVSHGSAALTLLLNSRARARAAAATWQSHGRRRRLYAELEVQREEEWVREWEGIRGGERGPDKRGYLICFRIEELQTVSTELGQEQRVQELDNLFQDGVLGCASAWTRSYHTLPFSSCGFATNTVVLLVTVVCLCCIARRNHLAHCVSVQVRARCCSVLAAARQRV